MQNVPQPDDHDDEFGAGPEVFARELRADDRVTARWQGEREKAAKASRSAPGWRSPIDAMPAIVAARAMPRMPWPTDWSEFERRVYVYPGDLVGVVGGPGSGKTQWGVQLGRAFAAAGRGCVLWDPLELSEADICLRIAANLTRRHVAEIRDSWPEQQIASALATVSDRWRFVDLSPTLAGHVAGLEVEIEAAKRIYQAPPLAIVDYAQCLAHLSDVREVRGATAQALEELRKLALRTQCYLVVLSQTSRSNTPALAGRVKFESASEAIGTAAESSEFERACASTIQLSVFKADDVSELDAHILVSKARHTGREGIFGARYHKAGGHWEELDHLPVTPLEVTAETKKAKRRKKGADGEDPSPPRTRTEMNAEKAEEAASARRAAVIAALRAAPEGLIARALRKVRGAGSPRRLQQTLDELQAAGRVRCDDRVWRFEH